MRDPQRLLQRHAGKLEAELLGSVRGEQPSASARARATAAFGAGTAAVASSSVAVASATGKTLGVSLLAAATKWFLVGAGASLMVMGVAHQTGWLPGSPSTTLPEASIQAPTRAPPATATARTRRLAEAKETSASVAGASVAGASLSVVPETSKPAPLRAPRSLATLRPSPLTPRDPSVELALEVQALDQAREAAHDQDPARALRLISDYQARFPRGKLLPEANVLRIEALIASGRKGSATDLARQFLRADPQGPLAERVQALLGEASK